MTTRQTLAIPTRRAEAVRTLGVVAPITMALVLAATRRRVQIAVFAVRAQRTMLVELVDDFLDATIV